MAANTGPVDDASVRKTLEDFLKKHGPTRTKPMLKLTRTPYDRSLRVLDAMQADGELEKVQDGYHRGDPVFAWCIKGDTRAPQNAVKRCSFGGEATLAAMRECASRAMAAYA